MTFTLRTHRAAILPSRPLTEQIDPGARLLQINTNPNIVHTKHWLFNEIPVAVFHFTSLVKVPIMFHFTLNSTSGQLQIFKLTFQSICWFEVV